MIGAGYWGPNLVRNLRGHPDVDLRWVCDLDPERTGRVVGRYALTRTTDRLDDVLSDPAVDAVVIATPAATHASLARACLDSGRHVLVEKPIACDSADADDLIAKASAAGLVLMCDHTYCYSPVVRHLRELIHSDVAGEVQYLDSVRINLGLVQTDVDVFWDLAPHDLSIIDFIVEPELRPIAVAAQGSDPVGAGRTCVGYLTLFLGNGALAHVHVNWLSPTKVRTMIIGGSRQMMVWDDLNPSQRLSVFDRGVAMAEPIDDERRREALVSYRLGDMRAPALGDGEALQGVVAEFVGSVRSHRRPLTDGESGARVLRILEAIPASLERGGAAVPIAPAPMPAPVGVAR